MKMVQKREKMGYKSKVSTAYKTAVASKWFLKLIFRRIGMNRPRLITSSFSKPSKVSFLFSCEYVFVLEKVLHSSSGTKLFLNPINPSL